MLIPLAITDWHCCVTSSSVDACLQAAICDGWYTEHWWTY